MGCGKSTVAHIFSALGIPVYEADERAKTISEQAETKERIAALFGPDAARNKRKLADIVFADSKRLAQLNALIHPLVFEDMDNWFIKLEKGKNPPPYAIVEAAILFDCGLAEKFDFIINVHASREEQIERCMARNHASLQEVTARIDRQISPEERIRKSHFNILNSDRLRVLPAALEIDRLLRQKASPADIQGK